MSVNKHLHLYYIVSIKFKVRFFRDVESVLCKNTIHPKEAQSFDMRWIIEK